MRLRCCHRSLAKTPEAVSRHRAVRESCRKIAGPRKAAAAGGCASAAATRALQRRCSRCCCRLDCRVLRSSGVHNGPQNDAYDRKPCRRDRAGNEQQVMHPALPTLDKSNKGGGLSNRCTFCSSFWHAIQQPIRTPQSAPGSFTVSKFKQSTAHILQVFNCPPMTVAGVAIKLPGKLATAVCNPCCNTHVTSEL